MVVEESWLMPRRYMGGPGCQGLVPRALWSIWWLEKWMSWSDGDFAIIGCLLIQMTIDKLIQVVAKLFAFFRIHVVWSFWSWWLARCFHRIRLLIVAIPEWVTICCCGCSQRGHCEFRWVLDHLSYFFFSSITLKAVLSIRLWLNCGWWWFWRY